MTKRTFLGALVAAFGLTPVAAAAVAAKAPRLPRFYLEPRLVKGLEFTPGGHTYADAYILDDEGNFQLSDDGTKCKVGRFRSQHPCRVLRVKTHLTDDDGSIPFELLETN